MLASSAANKKGKRKQAVLQTRKSLGGGKRGRDDSDNDFQPIKVTKKKAALIVAPAVRATAKAKPKLDLSCPMRHQKSPTIRTKL